jgi:hypothetical protein
MALYAGNPLSAERGTPPSTNQQPTRSVRILAVVIVIAIVGAGLIGYPFGGSWPEQEAMEVASALNDFLRTPTVLDQKQVSAADLRNVARHRFLKRIRGVEPVMIIGLAVLIFIGKAVSVYAQRAKAAWVRALGRNLSDLMLAGGIIGLVLSLFLAYEEYDPSRDDITVNFLVLAGGAFIMVPLLDQLVLLPLYGHFNQ